MIRTFYASRDSNPIRRGRLETVLLTALVMSPSLIGGCDRATAPASEGQSEVSAADRDTSLDAIDRWLTAGQPESGEAIARVLLRRLPRDPHVRLALARTLVARAGRVQAAEGPDAAAPLAREAAEILAPGIRPDTLSQVDLVAWNRTRGLALENAGLDAEAIDTYRETAGLDRVTALYLGLALLRVDETAEATRILEELASANEPDPFILAALAEARFDPEAPEEARTIVAQAVRLDPDAWAIRLRQAAIERRAGRPDVAIEMLSALSEEIRTERVVCEELARAWLAYGDPSRAGDIWANRARLYPSDLGAAIEAANHFGDAGRIDDAEAWIRIVEDVNPEDERIRVARARLDRAVSKRAVDTAP